MSFLFSSSLTVPSAGACTFNSTGKAYFSNSSSGWIHCELTTGNGQYATLASVPSFIALWVEASNDLNTWQRLAFVVVADISSGRAFCDFPAGYSYYRLKNAQTNTPTNTITATFTNTQNRQKGFVAISDVDSASYLTQSTPYLFVPWNGRVPFITKEIWDNHDPSNPGQLFITPVGWNWANWSTGTTQISFNAAENIRYSRIVSETDSGGLLLANAYHPMGFLFFFQYTGSYGLSFDLTIEEM
ncbi:hypothetical protein [Methylacidiphilum caldifontis]|uniref:Uncharacterized protein n=1 Tax=Methylacidiphilum caldifontis TaxID=2795386 RepID=A0A4Y8P8K8_9BACT|nr:hypothetical protein [Methylacidiphilum caldifontis]TFE66584.1 hypothetical protein A7Q10_02075 [Methylacidiphilum caldifontis]